MTRLFGFTYNYINRCVVGFGRRNAGAILLLLLGNFVGMKMSKEKED